MMHLENISTHSQLERIKENSKRVYRYFLAAIVGLVFLCILGCVHLIYTRKLKKTERLMQKTIDQNRLHERMLLAKLKAAEMHKLKPEEKLYIEICHYMDSETPYLDPDFNRDVMATALSTNRTYLGNSIRKFANGLTIQEFIIRYRLRHATSLLIGRPDLNINETGFLSGFKSRSSYDRMFRRFLGMLPTEYRELGERGENVWKN